MKTVLTKFVIAFLIVSTIEYSLAQGTMHDTPAYAPAYTPAGFIQYPNGDIIVNNGTTFEINELTLDPLSGERGKYRVDGNLTVDNATLIVKNASIIFMQDIYHRYTLNIKNNGKLQFENAKLFIEADAIMPYIQFAVNIENSSFPGSVIKNSFFEFPGFVNISNSYVTITNSTFTVGKLPSNLPDPDDFDDSPRIKIRNSTVMTLNSKFDKLYRNSNFKANYTFAPQNVIKPDDTTPQTSVSALLNDDNIYYDVPADTVMHIGGFDTSIFPPGDVFDSTVYITYQTAIPFNGQSKFNYSFDGINWVESSLIPVATTTEVTGSISIGPRTLTELSNLRIRYYNDDINTNTTVQIDQLFLEIQSANIGDNYQDNFNFVVENHSSFVAIDTFIDLDAKSPLNSVNPRFNQNPEHVRLYVRDNSTAYLLNVTIPVEAETGMDDSPMITDYSSYIYIYRWLKVNVVDKNMIPLANVALKADYNTQNLSSQLAQEVTRLNTISRLPIGTAINEYKKVKNISNTSDVYGEIFIPLVTDNISFTSWPNSLAVGNYRLQLNIGFSIIEQNLSFKSFPAFEPASNIKELSIIFGSYEQSAPNLVLTYSSLNIDYPLIAGQPLSGAITISNSGTKNADNVILLAVATHLETGTEYTIPMPMANVSANSQTTVQFSWNIPKFGNYIINVTVDPNNTVSEINENDNFVTSGNINYAPDIIIDTSNININPKYYLNETDTITISLKNPTDIRFTDLPVRLYDITEKIVINQTVTIRELASATVQFSYTPKDEGPHLVKFFIDPENTINETDESNNEFQASLFVISRPELNIENSQIIFMENNESVTESYVRHEITIVATINNSGHSNAENFVIALKDVYKGNTTYIFNQTISLLEGEKNITVNIPWTPLIDRTYNLTLTVDNENHVTESIETNNEITRSIVINKQKIKIDIYSPISTMTYTPGDTITIEGIAYDDITKKPVNDIDIDITLRDISQDLSIRFRTKTNSEGKFSYIYSETSNISGKFELTLTSNAGQITVNPSTLYIEIATPKGAEPPILLYALLILAVSVVVILLLFVFFVQQRRGTLVECGDCGAYIPENARTCPKCNAEFDISVVRCSECGAWISRKEKLCSECGALFTGRKEAKAPEEEQLRRDYKAYVNRFRMEAKQVLKDKYSETAFMSWWRKQPTYKTYAQFVAERKRTAPPTRCSSCGLLNDPSSKVCARCGKLLKEILPPEELHRAAPVSVKGPPPSQVVPLQQITPVQYTPPPPEAPVMVSPSETPPPGVMPVPPKAPPTSKPKIISTEQPKPSPPMPSQIQQPPVVRKVCPGCNREINTTFNVCPYCGARQ
mgnify:CR=1 FL=1